MALKEREKEHILNVLTKTQWDLLKTSRVLQIPLSRLTQKIREYELEHPDSEEFLKTKETSAANSACQ